MSNSRPDHGGKIKERMTNDINLLRHLLATLAYRFQYAVREAPHGFKDFDPGNGVMTPLDLVRHLNTLLVFVFSLFEEKDKVDIQLLDWEESIRRFHDLLASIDQKLEAGAFPNGITFEILLQGPFADALTHIGQLAVLRRLAGSPVSKGSFVTAKIEIGGVGMEQEI